MNRGDLWVHRGSFLVPLCLGLIVLADFLFYGQPMGWGVGLFGGIAAAAVAIRTPGLWRTLAGRIALTLAGIILLALVEEPSPLAILMAAFCLGMLALIGRGGWTSNLGAWAARWGQFLVILPLRWFLDNRVAARWFRRHPAQRPAGARLVFRWFVPLAAGCGFVILFATANPIIEEWVRYAWTQVATVLDWLPLYLRPARILLWILVGVGAYGLLRHRGWLPRRPGWIAVPPVVQPRASVAHHFIIRCLVVFNLVFAVQTVLDGIYLYGGAALPHGMTYAHYAHRGAYPLIATALLAGLFVLASFRSGGAAHRSAAARRLVYLWLGQNVFLLMSTIWRLWLYVDAYRLTRLRLATVIWLVLVAAGFLFLVWKIVAARSNAWLWRANAATLAGVLYVCAFVNFPGAIADFNVRHCQEAGGGGVPLDVDYLSDLGPAALPALERIGPRLTGERAVEAAKVRAKLRDDLAATLANWRGWTFRRYRTQRRIHVEKPSELAELHAR